MKQTKLVLKKILIVYVIIFILLSSISSSYAREFDASAGEYVSKYARDFIAKYCNGGNTVYDCSTAYAFFTGGSIGKGTFHACCSSGVHLMYKEALGIDLYKLGFAGMCSTALSNMRSSSNWQSVSGSEIRPGDIVINSGHTEMYVGNGQNANFGNDPHSGTICGGPRMGEFGNAFRLVSNDVNPTGKAGDALPAPQEENLNTQDENGFTYSGVAKIQGYKPSAPFGKWIVRKLSEILDYLIGILTLGIRATIVGWTSIVERFVNDGIVNAVASVTNKRDPSWQKDPSKIDEIDKEIAEEEKKEKEESDKKDEKNDEKKDEQKNDTTGDEADPNAYIGEGMQKIADIGGNVQLETKSENNVTIENIVYNKVPIFDVNFFNFETAGGATVDKDGVIYILKENVAMWYYIFRIIAIIIMLAILIYAGIKMAISTVAEKKAVYKEMLLSWLVGFLLVFAINYIMYAIINVNETFISWIIPKYEDGTEISLYETVKTKAFTIKATTGFIGMIMYIILVYFGIRFLIVYFRRYLTITILALMSPFVAVMYAFTKINKKGKGGEVFKNWLKDFMYTTWLQAIHALIYSIFVQTALTLTEVSTLGIFMAFLFLHFMTIMDGVFRNIFGFSAGKNATKTATVPKLAGQIGVAEGLLKSKEAKTVTSAYGKFMGATVGRPVRHIATSASNALDEAKNEFSKKFGTAQNVDKQTAKRMEKEKEEKKEARKEAIKNAANTAKLGANIIWAGAAGFLSIPMFIVEPAMGFKLLNSVDSSMDRINKLLKNAKKNGKNVKPKPTPSNKRFTLKGIQPRNAKSAERLKGRLDALRVRYKLFDNPDAINNPSANVSQQMGTKITRMPDIIDKVGLTFGAALEKILPDRKIQTKDISEIVAEEINVLNNALNSVKVEKVGDDVKIKIKDTTYETLEEFLNSDEYLTPEEGYALIKGLDAQTIESLSAEDRKKLAKKIGVTPLQLTSSTKAPEEIMGETIEDGDIDKTEQLMEILIAAKVQEKELEQMQKEITGTLEALAEKMQEVSPEFAKSLQTKKAKELSRVAYILAEPLSEKDIFNAMRNYQSEVPQFDPNADRLSQQDIKGITAKLNEILKKRGTDMQMSKEFMQKVEKEVTDQHRREKEKQESINAQKAARAGVGSDVTAKSDQQSLKERVKAVNAPDRNNPNAESNPNAPKQNESNLGGATSRLAKGSAMSSVDTLVKKIKNASKGASSKTTKWTNPRVIEYSRKLEDLQKLNEEVQEITGDKLYDIADVIRRLETL